jgi:choline-sulfatase
MPSDQPNVLFLLSDEHSYRCLGTGAPEREREPVSTDSLDRLAANGTVFNNAYCPVPLCTPSRASILTGREQRNSGGWDSGTIGPWAPHPDTPTLPGTFSENGYETCLVGKMHLGGERQFCGFDHRPYGDLAGIGGHQPEPIDPYSRANGIWDTRSRTADAGVTEIPESLLQERTVVEESLAYLREHRHENGDHPWLLCASFSRPHFPQTAPSRYFDRYWPEGVTEPKVGMDSDAAAHPSSEKLREGQGAGDRSTEEAQRARAAYFACVEYLDEIVGDFLSLLERENFLEDTIVVYTSDHGEMAGEHGLWWKQTWQEGSARVPMIVQTPEQRNGSAPPRSLETPVSLTDLYPTLCSLSGLPVPSGLDGTDLAEPVCSGGEFDRVPVFIDMLMPRKGDDAFRAIRDGRYKYVGFRDQPDLLFDLEVDPFERADLSEDPDGEDAEALRRFRVIFGETVDFDDIEATYERHSEELAAYRGGLPNGTSGNMYTLPDGRVVDADLPLYRPHVMSEDPESDIPDWPDSDGDRDDD